MQGLNHTHNCMHMWIETNLRFVQVAISASIACFQHCSQEEYQYTPVITGNDSTHNIVGFNTPTQL